MVTAVAVGAVLITACVVTAKGSESVPMVTDHVCVVALVAGAVHVIATVSVLLTTDVARPVLMPLIINVPKVVETDTCVPSPATVMVLLVQTLLGTTFVMSVTLNALGVLSIRAAVTML
jgi:hypothetical protein